MTTKLGSDYLVFGEKNSAEELDARRINLLRNYKEAQEIFIKTADNILLNSMLIRQPNSFLSFFKSKKLIIYFNGRKSAYEKLEEKNYILNAHKLGLDVLLFNYRGVGKSKGNPTPDGLVKDGQAILNYALSRYNPKNIIVHGFSLGGAVAVKALASSPSRYEKIKFISDRSFSSIKAVIDSSSILKIFKIILLFLLKICNWNIDAAKEWKKIKNPKLISYSDSDDAIPFKASLYYEAGKNASAKAFVLKNYKHCQKLSYPDMRSLVRRV